MSGGVRGASLPEMLDNASNVETLIDDALLISDATFLLDQLVPAC